MDDMAGGRESTISGDGGALGHGERTVEDEIRSKLTEELGGPRGSFEAALPLLVFTLVYLIIDELGPAILIGVGSALMPLAVRLVQRSTMRFVGNGVIGIAIAAIFAMATGRAEAAFLPNIVQNAVWVVALGASILVRRPLAGFVIGAVLGDVTGWRNDSALVRLANRLTIVLLVPMVVRVAVQYPLYLAGEVGWLGVARIVLGWPLTAVAVAVVGVILMRGRTPLRPRHKDERPNRS